MEVNQIKSEGLIRVFKAVISKEHLLQKETEELNNIAKRVSLNGFRKGKAPLEVIKKNYEQSVLVKVLNELTKTLLLKIYTDYNLTPITDPKVDITNGDLLKREDITLNIELEIYPEIGAIDFEQIILEKVNLTVTEEDTNSFLDRLSQQYFVYEDIEDDRPLQMGDIVSIDFVGRIDGQVFEGGSAKDFKIELGSKTFIDNFEEQLVGAKPNDERDVVVRFPEDYRYKPEYSNKEATFSVKINRLQKKTHTSLSDLPQKLGFESLESLKEDVAKRHLHQYEMLVRKDLKHQLIGQLVDIVNFELPSRLLDRETQIMKKDFEQYKSAKAQGRTEPHPEYDDKTEEEIFAAQNAAATHRVKLSLIFNSIAETNNINVSREEVEQFIKQEAERYGEKSREVMNDYRNNKTIINNIRNFILEDKILNFIFAKIKYNELAMSLGEYNKHIQDQNKAYTFLNSQ